MLKKSDAGQPEGTEKQHQDRRFEINISYLSNQILFHLYLHAFRRPIPALLQTFCFILFVTIL